MNKKKAYDSSTKFHSFKEKVAAFMDGIASKVYGRSEREIYSVDPAHFHVLHSISRGILHHMHLSFICRIKLQTFRFGFALLTRHPFATITSRLHAMPWHKLIAKKSSSYKNEIYIWEKEKSPKKGKSKWLSKIVVHLNQAVRGAIGLSTETQIK